MKKFYSVTAFILTFALLCGCDKHSASAKAEVKKAKIGDVEIAYYTRGQGDPLVMIMGFRGTMAIWDPALLEILEKKYTLVLFDNRGAGLSTDTKQDLTTIAQMATDTALLIKFLGYEKAHVLGWSMGSRIAQELVVSYPEVVDKLILCSPNPGGQHQALRKTNSFGEMTAQDLSKEKALSLIFPDTTEGHLASAKLVARLTEAIARGSVPDDLHISQETIKRQVHALQQWDKNDQAYETLTTIFKPTLVVGGLMDTLDQPENARRIASRIPFAWSAYFAGAGHDFLSQDHEHFAQLVTLFIESSSEPR